MIVGVIVGMIVTVAAGSGAGVMRASSSRLGLRLRLQLQLSLSLILERWAAHRNRCEARATRAARLRAFTSDGTYTNELVLREASYSLWPSIFAPATSSSRSAHGWHARTARERRRGRARCRLRRFQRSIPWRTRRWEDCGGRLCQRTRLRATHPCQPPPHRCHHPRRACRRGTIWRTPCPPRARSLARERVVLHAHQRVVSKRRLGHVGGGIAPDLATAPALYARAARGGNDDARARLRQLDAAGADRKSVV